MFMFLKTIEAFRERARWTGPIFLAAEQSGYDGYIRSRRLAGHCRPWPPPPRYGDLFPDAMGLCRDGLAHIKSNVK